LSSNFQEADARDSEKALAQIFREVFLRVVQNKYWEAIEEGIIPRNLRVARILLQSTDEALDNAWLGLNDWDVISRDVNMDKPGFFMRTMAELVEYPPLSWIVEARRTFSNEFRTTRKIYATLCYREAHTEAREEFPKLFGNTSPMDAKVMKQLMEESEKQCRLAHDLLKLLPLDAVEVGRSEMLARKLLQTQSRDISYMKEQGLLTSTEANKLSSEVQKAIRRIVDQPNDAWSSMLGGRFMPVSPLAAVRSFRRGPT